MNKKIKMGTRPSTSAAVSPAADDWVDDAAGKGEPTKRLTIDIPASLHRKIKSTCAMRDAKMADEIRTMLEKKYA